MRILFFSPYFFPYTSGLTTYPKLILKHFAENHQVTVLTFKYDKGLSDREKVDGFKVVRIGYLLKISKGFMSPQSLSYFYKSIRNSDLLILNQPNFEGLFLAFLAKIFKKKVVSIFHCQVFLANNLQNRIVNFFLDQSVKTQLILSDKIVAYTKDYFYSLKDFRQFRKRTIFTLPPINQMRPNQTFLRRLSVLKKDDVWIGYSGRIASEKGLEYLVLAISQLNKKGIKFVLAGPYGKNVAGENNYYKKIKHLLVKQKINHYFFGNLDDKQLSAFYKTIDVLILPSINQTEAFGMVQAEAMLSGTPVVASDLPGVRIPIRLTKMGIVVEPKNIKELSLAIKSVLKNRKKFANENLVKKAKETFVIKNVYKFYDHLLGEKN